MRNREWDWGAKLHGLLCFLGLHLHQVRKQSEKAPRRKECVICGHCVIMAPLPKRNRAATTTPRNSDVTQTEPPTVEEIDQVEVPISSSTMRPASEDLDIEEGRNE